LQGFSLIIVEWVGRRGERNPGKEEGKKEIPIFPTGKKKVSRKNKDRKMMKPGEQNLLIVSFP